MPARRAYGMDQDFYPWPPIVARPPLLWPQGARVALAVIVNLEHWNWEMPASAPVAVSPMGGPEGLCTGNQPPFPDIGGYGNHEYGNTVGIFRIFAVLDSGGGILHAATGARTEMEPVPRPRRLAPDVRLHRRH